MGAALLFSTGGAAIKLCGMSGWQVASLRSLVAAVALAAVLKGARRGWDRRTLMVGVAYAVTVTLFVLSNKLTTAANATFLQSTAPFYILALSPWLLSERARRSDLALMAAIAVGLALFFVQREDASVSAPDPFTGNLLGAVTGISYALTLMGLRWLERGTTEPAASATPAVGVVKPKRAQAGLAAVVAGNLIAAALGAPMAWPVGGSTLDWGLVGYLGVLQIGLAYLLLTYGFRRVPAFEGSLIILLEPALSPVWAWLVHDEVPGGLALAGGTVIIGATTLKGWFDERQRRRSLPA